MHYPIVSDEEILKYANVLPSDRSTRVRISHYERWPELNTPPYDDIPCIEFDLLSTTYVTKSTFCEIRRTSKGTLIKVSTNENDNLLVYNEIRQLLRLSPVEGVPKVLSQVLYNGNVVGFEMDNLGVMISPAQAKANKDRILTIVKSIHAHGVCHFDLAIRNILIDKEGNVSIIDFGSALQEGVPIPKNQPILISSPIPMPSHATFDYDLKSLAQIDIV
ncbi:hypothetical protein GGI23_000011 [Coemansia sp. RSA 2559]|nr:hypothetical protein GGI23_000011 [Coemansia sp. RSA 2559]